MTEKLCFEPVPPDGEFLGGGIVRRGQNGRVTYRVGLIVGKPIVCTINGEDVAWDHNKTMMRLAFAVRSHFGA